MSFHAKGFPSRMDLGILEIPDCRSCYGHV